MRSRSQSGPRVSQFQQTATSARSLESFDLQPGAKRALVAFGELRIVRSVTPSAAAGRDLAHAAGQHLGGPGRFGLGRL